jgi:hypothetical protein
MKLGWTSFLARAWRAGFGRKGPPAPEPAALRNWDEAALRAEFKRRYLGEFSRYVADDMVANHNAAISFAILAAILAGASFAGPVAILAGGGLALRHFLIRRDLGAAVCSAGKALKRDLESGGEGKLDGIEAWLDRHVEDLPYYLDKLDRADDEQRRVRRIIARINQAGTAASLSRDERRLLARHGYRRLKPPIATTLRLPPRTELGSRHHAQLARSLWRDVAREAGDRGRPFKRLLGLARIGQPAERR